MKTCTPIDLRASTITTALSHQLARRISGPLSGHLVDVSSARMSGHRAGTGRIFSPCVVSCSSENSSQAQPALITNNRGTKLLFITHTRVIAKYGEPKQAQRKINYVENKECRKTGK